MIHIGSNLDILPTLPYASVDLILTDPPYNVGESYDGFDDSRSPSAYMGDLERVVSLCKETLRHTGSIVVIQGDKFAAETKILLDDYFILRQWCIWHYTFGPQCKSKFTPSHVHIFQYTFGSKYTFNANVVKVPSDRQIKYGDKRAKAGGKVPDDVMMFSRVCGTFKERRGTPNQLPEALVERWILACSNAGDTVLDPYCGSGTVPSVAKRLGRNGIGIELVPAYHTIAKERFCNG